MAAARRAADGSWIRRSGRCGFCNPASRLAGLAASSLNRIVAIIKRSVRVPYSAGQMLSLVNDIGSYPEFLHWCRAARVETSSGAVVEAALDIGIGGIFKTMRTRNETTIGDERRRARIRIEMIDGPLKRLAGEWNISEHASGGCDVELVLDYEVHRTPFGMLLRTVFDEIANSQLNAFIRRAGVLYDQR